MGGEEIVSELKLPELDFLRFGNIFSGGYDDFNFKLYPNVDEAKFEVYVWFGCYCLNKSDQVSSKEFEMDEAGRLKAQEWILSEFGKFQKSNE